MKRCLMITAAFAMLLAVSMKSAQADHWSRGRGGSNLGISVSYGNGFNNVGVSYGRGYPINRSYGGYGYGGGFAPVYNPYPTFSVPVYSSPVYGGGYGGYGGGYGGGFGGGYGGGYGGHHHHGHCGW